MDNDLKSDIKREYYRTTTGLNDTSKFYIWPCGVTNFIIPLAE